MSQFVIFLSDEGLHKCIVRSARKAGAQVFKSFDNKYMNKLFKLHNSWILNKTIELPFKSIWFNRCLKGMRLNDDEPLIFVFYESFHMTYSKRFLNHCKHKYKNSIFVYVFLNPISESKLRKYKSIETFFEKTVAIYDEDAKKYGFLINEFYCYDPPEVENSMFEESDVFFIGANKGRFPKILEVYERLSAIGLKCDFHVVGVDAEQQKYKDSITYNRPMSYEEALQRTIKSKCLLEILQDNDNYFSIRTIEALHFRKKLLTTNKEIVNYSFYDPRIIQIYEEADYIDIQFFKGQCDESIYPDNKLWSFEKFEQYILDNIISQ